MCQKGVKLIFQNELEQIRIAKANELKASGYNPYPHFLHRDMSITDFKAKFEYIKNINGDDKKADIEICVAGRLKLKRVAGKSTFANIEDENDSIQVYYSLNSIGESDYNAFKKNLEVGDIILVKGYAFITKTGEFSIHASKITLAS